MTYTSDAPTQQLPALRTTGSTGRRRVDLRGAVPMDVLEATRVGLVDLDDYAPRQLTGAVPTVPELGLTF